MTESIGRNRAEELYERARALRPEARAAFLAEACRGDPRSRPSWAPYWRMRSPPKRSSWGSPRR